jgi:hypothetical protein
MANEKDNKKTEKAPTIVDEFRKKLRNKEQIKATVTEGLKHANGRIRSLAIKAAFKLRDHAFVKQHVLPLITSDKSKKVLRTLSDKVTRKELYKKVKASRVMKKFGTKKEAGADAAAPAAPETKA